MAGGKETPRQRMIGMMYLVLTAILALNVSQSVLDAFVAIEENLQKSNLFQVERGNVFLGEVRAELSSSKGEELKAKRERLEYAFRRMNEIDSLTAGMIQFLDDLKLEMLTESGEDVSQVHEGDETAIYWKKGSNCVPMRLNLAAVEGQDRFDEPMYVMGIADDIRRPVGKGMELWEKLLNFRSEMVKLTGTYQWSASAHYEVRTQAINDFKSANDLYARVAKMMDANKQMNSREDRQVLTELYVMLTKKERNKVHDLEDVHWVGMTFDHAPVVAAVASLSSLQQDVLAARNLALGHWRSKLGMDEYGFNSIMPLAYGQPIANKGDSVYLEVMMVAHDSYNQPEVKVVSGADDAKVHYPQNGRGVVGFKVSATGEQVITGTVAVRNKAGILKQETWEYKVKVMQPMGSISLPQLNVLYRGYANEVQATASGFDETNLTGTGVKIKKSGAGWIITPESVKKATLTVSGRNSITGKATQLYSQEYRVLPLPNAILYCGASKDGERIGTGATKLFPKYDESVPLNVDFKVLDWTCEVQGYLGKPVTGKGNDFSAALPIMRQAKPGTTVVFKCRVLYPGNETRVLRGVYSL